MKAFFSKKSTIAIITEVGNRLGDASAVKQLADKIKENFSDYNIEIILYDVKANVSLIFEESKFQTMTGGLEIADEEFINHLKSKGVDKIIFYPNIPDISQHGLEELKAKLFPLKIDIICCYEYDYILNPGLPHAIQTTGLSRGALGCFLEQTPLYDKSVEDEFKDVMTVVNSHSGLEKLFAGLCCEDLLKDVTIFMGYHNPDMGTYNYEFTPTNYASICYKIANAEKKKHFYFFINKENLLILAQTFLNEGASEVALLDAQGEVTQVLKNDSAKTGLKVSISDPYPMKMSIFDSLQKIAHPFVYLTGDQSASKGLSTYHFLYKSFGILCYQIKNWKVLFYYAMLERAVEFLGLNSPYTKFLHLLKGDRRLDEDCKQEIVNLVIDSKMGEETKKFFDALNQYYNFGKNFKKLFESRIEPNVSEEGEFWISYQLFYDQYVTLFCDFPEDILDERRNETLNNLAHSVIPVIYVINKNKPNCQVNLFFINEDKFLLNLVGFSKEISQKIEELSADEFNKYHQIEISMKEFTKVIDLLNSSGITLKIDDAKIKQLKEEMVELRKSVLEYNFPFEKTKGELVFNDHILESSALSTTKIVNV